LLLLAVLWLVFFADLVVHPTAVLYSDHSDFLAETLPAKRFLVREVWVHAEIPLWQPYSYAGNPFLHDLKTAVYYPPHLPLYCLPDEAVGPALSWITALHVLLAGATMYGYARTQELGAAGALTAAVGYMFAGKWMLHLLAGGHAFFAPLAWLPLVLLAMDRAVRRRSFAWAVWAAAAFALIVLGAHPQLTFYAAVFAAVWSLGPALDTAGFLGGAGPRSLVRTANALVRWLGLGLLTAATAAALAAVVLLQAVEAAREASRGAGVPSDDSWGKAALVLLRLVGPSVDGPQWEERGGFGVMWLATAALAPVLRRGRVRFQAAVLGLAVFFALGGATVVQGLPGFNLFQIHSRMLLPAAAPLALLAGVTIDSLFEPDAAKPAVARRTVASVGVIAVAPAVAAAAFLDFGSWRRDHEGGPAEWVQTWEPRAMVYVPLLVIGLPLLYWLAGKRAAGGAAAQMAWTTLLLAELWVVAWPLVRTRSPEQVYRPSACVAYLKDNPTYRIGEFAYPARILDRGQPPLAPETPLTPALAVVWEIEPLRGYNSVDVRRYREYLKLIAGSDEPLRPREEPFGFPTLPNLDLKNKPLLDLLGTAYLLQPTRPPLDLKLGLGPGWEERFQDDRPAAYQAGAGGVRLAAAFTVYANTEVFPRAFVVPEATPLPEPSRVPAALKGADFRRTVFLEGYSPAGGDRPHGEFRPAEIRDSRPNRIVVGASGGAPGWLVLTDVWFPGWTAEVDGKPTTLYRADFLFRAVAVPAGDHEVAFTFAPASYWWGRWISGAALGGIAALTAAVAILRLRRRADA
jgi:hypothetical protein